MRIRCDKVSSIKGQNTKAIDSITSHFIILVFEWRHEHRKDMLHKGNYGVAHSKHYLSNNICGVILATCVLQNVAVSLSKIYRHNSIRFDTRRDTRSWELIFRVRIALRRTVVGSNDWCFHNLNGNHHQSWVKCCRQSSVISTVRKPVSSVSP